MALERTLFQVSVKESEKNREYWLQRPWISDRKQEVMAADVLLVPWENFRENEPALFPQGTAQIYQAISKMGDISFGLASDEQEYREIALHSKLSRLPQMVVTTLMLPALAGMLGNLMSDSVHGGKPDDLVEFKVIVQGTNGRCIDIEYKGPATRLADTLIDEVERCFPGEVSNQQASD